MDLLPQKVWGNPRGDGVGPGRDSIMRRIFLIGRIWNLENGSLNDTRASVHTRQGSGFSRQIRAPHPIPEQFPFYFAAAGQQKWHGQQTLAVLLPLGWPAD